MVPIKTSRTPVTNKFIRCCSLWCRQGHVYEKSAPRSLHLSWRTSVNSQLETNLQFGLSPPHKSCLADHSLNSGQLIKNKSKQNKPLGHMCAFVHIIHCSKVEQCAGWLRQLLRIESTRKHNKQLAPVCCECQRMILGSSQHSALLSAVPNIR